MWQMKSMEVPRRSKALMEYQKFMSREFVRAVIFIDGTSVRPEPERTVMIALSTRFYGYIEAPLFMASILLNHLRFGFPPLPQFGDQLIRLCYGRRISRLLAHDTRWILTFLGQTPVRSQPTFRNPSPFFMASSFRGDLAMEYKQRHFFPRNKRIGATEKNYSRFISDSRVSSLHLRYITTRHSSVKCTSLVIKPFFLFIV